MLIMGRWEIPVRAVAQGGFATTLAGSVFHCRAVNALRHAHIAVIKHILKQRKKKDNQNSQVCAFLLALEQRQDKSYINVYHLSSPSVKHDERLHFRKKSEYSWHFRTSYVHYQSRLGFFQPLYFHLSFSKHFLPGSL